MSAETEIISIDEVDSPYIPSLIGGGVAGFVVDCVLYPLDTLKTRLQAAEGFQKSGGFRGIYKGIGPQAIGSGPMAALFFVTYESFKHHTIPYVPSYANTFVYMIGASLGEVVACIVRVPTEVVKQRRQTSSKSSWYIARKAYKTSGIRGLYRGFGSTVIREVPFSFIQFPILEYLKIVYEEYGKDNVPLEPWEVAICGAIAGGASAAVTTPLDVVKTRIMLADYKARKRQIGFWPVMKTVYKNEGMRALYSGFIPRTIWLSVGAYFFFGVYDMVRQYCKEFKYFQNSADAKGAK